MGKYIQYNNFRVYKGTQRHSRAIAKLILCIDQTFFSCHLPHFSVEQGSLTFSVQGP